MKILRIIARLNIGGPARNVVLLSHSDMWDTVLVSGNVDKEEGDMTYLAREKGISTVVVNELKRELSLKNDWRAFWKIYGIICREKPDIIHTHTAKAGTLGRLAGLLYKITHFWRYKKVSLVHTFHGHVLHGYFGEKKARVFIWIERTLALFTDRIIAVSRSLKEELAGKFKIAPEEKFSVLELGFELDKILELPVKEQSECIHVGIIGRLVPIKNHRMLFRIVQSATHKSQSANRIAHGVKQIRFVVIGDGELRADLERYSKELGISDIVEFRGWIRNVEDIYRDLDIVVLTSLNEGTPVSIIEAMAASRSVVATSVGGVKDLVQDGESGYLVNSNDEETFSNRLLDLICDAEKRKRFADRGRGLVRDRFSKDRLIKDMDRLYNDVLKTRKV